MAVTFQDYYSILGVPREISQKELQRAYRKLARKYHPDVNNTPGSEDKFKKINEAYGVLKDPEKRKKYDAMGADWKAGDEFQPPPSWETQSEGQKPGARSQSFHFDGGEGTDFSDFFKMFFGEEEQPDSPRRSASRPRAGASHEANLTISLEEIFHGAAKPFFLTVHEDTGQGQIVKKKKKYEVKILPGVKEGSIIRLAGEGGKGINGGPLGDLFLRIHISPHPRFLVKGSDLYTSLPIAPWEAVLGATVAFKTLIDTGTITIPRGSQSGNRLRLRGKGLPKKGGSRGDLLVELKVVVPIELTQTEEELYTKLKEISSFNPRSGQN